MGRRFSRSCRRVVERQEEKLKWNIGPDLSIKLTGLILAVTLVPLTMIFGLLIWWLRRKKEAITRQWGKEGLVFFTRTGQRQFFRFRIKRAWDRSAGTVLSLSPGKICASVAPFPQAEWRIPYDQIKQVTLEASFLGKRKSANVLVITFEHDGQPDRLGVYVRDDTAWVKAIATGSRAIASRGIVLPGNNT